jgi:hypothetical protein
LRRGAQVAATMTVHSGGRVLRRLELAVLPHPPSSAGRSEVAILLTAAWQAAATLCEGS